MPEPEADVTQEPEPEPAPSLNGASQPATSEPDQGRIAATIPSDEAPTRTLETDPSRTESNKTEQESEQNPVQTGGSDDPDPNSPPSSIQKAIDDIDRQLQMVLSHRDWLNDFPPNNPGHPERQRALRLVERKQALVDQLASTTDDPAAA